MMTKAGNKVRHLGRCVALAIAMLGVPTWATTAATPPVAMPTSVNTAQGVLPDVIRAKMAVAGLSDDEISLWVEPLTDDLANANADDTPSQPSTRHTPIIRHRADKLRTPASTQKLITTAIALNTLGENHRWLTNVYPKGVIINGVLYGNLVIQGNGDPAMTHDRLRAMLQSIQAQGIHHIHGDIIIDNTAFDGVKFDINAFDGQGMRAYNAAPNAFLVNFGTVEVDVLPSGHDELIQNADAKPIKHFVPSDNQNAAMQVLPKLADFESPSQIAANNKSCLSDGKFHLSEDKLTVFSGTNAACGRRSYWLTFGDADTLAIKAVKGEWQRLDERFDGVVRLGRYQGGSLPWLSYVSKPLSEQIYLINQYSNNVMTEQVALSLPLSVANANSPMHTPSNYAQAFAFINRWWQDNLTSQPPMMSRASGLCRDCAITPSAMAELLAFMYHQPNFEVFKTSLPIAGQSGTMASLAERNPTHPAIGRAFIKTGTLNDVKSMAGYVMDNGGKWYVFVAMVNTPDAGHDAKVTAVLDEALAYVATLQ